MKTKTHHPKQEKKQHKAASTGTFMADNRPKTKAQLQLQKAMRPENRASLQKQENNTGLPDSLKTGIENLSGPESIINSNKENSHNSSDVMQLKAKIEDALHETTIVIAGEFHNEYDDEKRASEKELWLQDGIQVIREYEKIPTVTDKGEEHFDSRRLLIRQSHTIMVQALTNIYKSPTDFYLNELMQTVLQEYGTARDALEAINDDKDKELEEWIVLALNYAYEMMHKTIGKSLQNNEQEFNEVFGVIEEINNRFLPINDKVGTFDEVRMARTEVMLNRVNKYKGKLEGKYIYKVGESHIDDIRMKLGIVPDFVYTDEEYKTDVFNKKVFKGLDHKFEFGGTMVRRDDEMGYNYEQ